MQSFVASGMFCGIVKRIFLSFSINTAQRWAPIQTGKLVMKKKSVGLPHFENHSIANHLPALLSRADLCQPADCPHQPASTTRGRTASSRRPCYAASDAAFVDRASAQHSLYRQRRQGTDDTFFLAHKNSLFAHSRFSALFFSKKMAGRI